MRSERMILLRGHDAGVAQKVPVAGLDGPATEAVSAIRIHIVGMLCVAGSSADRSPQIAHDLGVRVQRREQLLIGLAPRAKTGTGRVDHHPVVLRWRALFRRGAK